MVKFRLQKKLGELGPLFLTQQQLWEYYKLIESRVVEEEMAIIMTTLFNGADENLGSFFRGFLVKAFNKVMNAFILVPIHTVQLAGEDGQLQVEVRLHERDGSVKGCWLALKDIWPTHPSFQERARKEPTRTLGDSDVYYVVAITELQGDQYLFPIIPKATRIRKKLLRRLFELQELRHKHERCVELAQRAAGVCEKISEADRDLQLINVQGHYRPPNESEKDAIWARKEQLEAEHTRHIEAMNAVGFDENTMEEVRRRVQSMVEELHSALQEPFKEAEEEAAKLRYAPAGCGPEVPQALPQDPRRQDPCPSGAAPRWSGAGPGPATDSHDNLRAAKRSRTPGDNGFHAPQEARSPRPTQLQLQFLQAHAELLQLLYKHGAVGTDGVEDWSKLGDAAQEQANQMEHRCQELEAQLRVEGQAVPDQIQVARHYAGMVQEQCREHEQKPSHKPKRQERPMVKQEWSEDLQVGAQRQGLPAQAGELQQQGSCKSLQQHLQGQHTTSQQLPQQSMPKMRVPSMKWKGNIALGQNGEVKKELLSGSIWAEPMRTAGSASSISDLKNTWIPMVFPVVEPIPDLKDLIPEVGVLSFENPRDLSSMVEFAHKQGWYADSMSKGVSCGKSSVLFKHGYLARQEMTVYIFTHKSSWAQETLVGKLRDTQQQLFMSNRAFLLLFRMGSPKRPDTALPTRGSDSRERPWGATSAAAAPLTKRAPAKSSGGGHTVATAAAAESAEASPSTAAPVAKGPTTLGMRPVIIIPSEAAPMPAAAPAAAAGAQMQMKPLPSPQAPAVDNPTGSQFAAPGGGAITLQQPTGEMAAALQTGAEAAPKAAAAMVAPAGPEVLQPASAAQLEPYTSTYAGATPYPQLPPAYGSWHAGSQPAHSWYQAYPDYGAYRVSYDVAAYHAPHHSYYAQHSDTGRSSWQGWPTAYGRGACGHWPAQAPSVQDTCAGPAQAAVAAPVAVQGSAATQASEKVLGQGVAVSVAAANAPWRVLDSR